MNKNTLIRYSSTPLEHSLEPVTRELGSSPLLVAVNSPTSDNIEFAVASDNLGKLWIYVFTDKEELTATFPSGAAFAEMMLVDILATVGPDERFGGIFINSKSESRYMIPREGFAFAYNLLTPVPDQ